MLTDKLVSALGANGARSGSPAPVTNALGGQDGGGDLLEQLKRMLSRNTAYSPDDSFLAFLRAILDDGGGGGGGGGGGNSTGCLHGDTLVRMADGSEKPAREIVVEDLIMGYDFDLKQKRPQSVFTVQSSRQPCMVVGFSGAAPDVIASVSHPWMERDGDVVFTPNLIPGETALIGEDGKPVFIEHLADAGSHIVYWWNCTMNHNYYAGGVLHHNEGGGFGGASGTNTFGGLSFSKGTGGGGNNWTSFTQGGGGAGSG